MVENKKLRDKVESLEAKELVDLKENLIKSIKKINDFNALVFSSNMSSKLLKNLSFDLLKNSEKLFLALFSINNNRVIFNIGISKDLLKQKNWNASDLVKEFSKYIEGSGGGQDFFASASGKKIENVELVMNKVNSFLQEN